MNKFHGKSCTYRPCYPPPLPQVLINKKIALKEKYTCIQKHHDGNISTTKLSHKILVTGEQCGVPF